MQWMQKYIIKLLVIGSSFLPLLATADLFNWFHSAETSVKELCAKKAGIQLNKKLLIKGYFDERDGCASCWLDLVELPVTWVEFCQTQPNRFALVSKAGCWRLSEVSRTQQNKLCDKRLNIALKRSTYRVVENFRGSRCINVEYLESPTAQISLKKESAIISQKNRYTIEKQQIKLFDKNSQQNLASSTTFAYSKKNNSKPQYCEHYIDEMQALSRKELVMHYINTTTNNL